MADFAIITFRNTGPIKTWSDMRAANIHNARTKPIEHAVEGAPAPQFLIGSNDLVADVKRKLRAAKIDPDRLRKNGVIAYEAILTASANFFAAGTEAERQTRLEAWTSAQVEWAMKRYGPHRIASMVLHVDEKTPHVHLVVLPLDVKSDKRRRDTTEVRWGLVGRTISGPGRFDEVQDDYAAAMAPFGLVRGVRGSGRKHEPVPVYLARMEQKEREADEWQRSLIASQQEADLDRGIVAAERRAVAKLRAEAIMKAEAAERELADARELKARAERYRAELAAFADQLTDVRTQVVAQRDANRVEKQRLAQIALQAGAFLDRVRAVSFPDAAMVSATNAAIALQAAARSSEASRRMGGR